MDDFIATEGREDGFTIMGGDATAGTFTTMYDGVRPFQPEPGYSVAAGTGTMPLELTACNASAANQQFGVYHELNSTSIATVIAGKNFCLDIQHFGKTAGSLVYAWPVESSYECCSRTLLEGGWGLLRPPSATSWRSGLLRPLSVSADARSPDDVSAIEGHAGRTASRTTSSGL